MMWCGDAPRFLVSQMMNFDLLLNAACRHGPRAGIVDTYEGHQGPIRGMDCHNSQGPIDFSHLFLTSSVDWTVKLWSLKVIHPSLIHPSYLLLIIATKTRSRMKLFHIVLLFVCFFFVLFCRRVNRCTLSKTTATMSTTWPGLLFIRQFSPPSTVWAGSTYGTLTRTQR